MKKTPHASLDLEKKIGSATSLVEVVRLRAQLQSDRRAFTFLPRPNQPQQVLTYGELDLRARNIAGRLQALGKTGDRVILFFPPGLDYIIAFMGCLYAGMVAVPLYPPRRQEKYFRAAPVIESCLPPFALTNSATKSLISDTLQNDEACRRIQVLTCDDIPRYDDRHAWRSKEHPLAFLQYTSGSTGDPKGVMVSHANIMANQRAIQASFQSRPDDICFSWLPLYHDMGLIGAVLHALYVGFPTIFMPSVAFVREPLAWLEGITRYRATLSGAPNFAYELLLDRFKPDWLSRLDLSSWRVAFNGAEPVRGATLTLFIERFTTAGFRAEAFFPCYGMAEATLFVSGGKVDARPKLARFQAAAMERNRVIVSEADTEPSRLLVGCGSPAPGHDLLICDPDDLNLCSEGQIGEIWLRGPSVSEGYWSQEEQTRKTFNRSLKDVTGCFLATGDLGFLQDGELFVTGRLKDLIIVRGRNHYPQDIEATVSDSHPDLKSGGCAAFSVLLDGEERLVVAAEINRRKRQDLKKEDVVAEIRSSVSQAHELLIHEIVLLRQGTLPKTSSGKIRRKLCKRQYLDGNWTVVASSLLPSRRAISNRTNPSIEELTGSVDSLKAYLCQLVARVLGVLTEDIHADLVPASLGIDSMLALELQYQLEQDLGISLDMNLFLEGASIRELAVQAMKQWASSPVKPAPETLQQNSQFPLSHNQKTLYFLYRLNPTSPAYNLSFGMTTHSPLPPALIEATLNQLIERHPSLRTTYHVRGEELYQRVAGHWDAPIRQMDATDWSARQLQDYLKKEAQRPFNLKKGPLFRVLLLVRANGRQVLQWSFHHIAVDYASLMILLNEFGAIYGHFSETPGIAPKLKPLPVSYEAYVRDQARILAGSHGHQLWSYWRAQLAGGPKLIDLPIDKPRPAIQGFTGACHSFTINPDCRPRLESLARQHETTLFTVLLAAFQALLYRYTGQDDLHVGTPTMNRRRAEFKEVVGYFVNPVVVRGRPDGSQSFNNFVQQIRQTVLAGIAHRDFPFQILVEKLRPEREMRWSPLFQVLFTLQQPYRSGGDIGQGFALRKGGARTRLGGLEWEATGLLHEGAQFDLSLVIGTGSPQTELEAWFEYDSNLFFPHTIARMARHFENLLEQVCLNPRQLLVGLPLAPKEELDRQLHRWNGSNIDLPGGQCIHHLFEARAAQTPDAPTLTYSRYGHADETLTYKQLNERADHLAEHLIYAGAGPEKVVGICLERGVEMVVALLAILKSGATYLPLDPTYPADRLQYMLEDADTVLLVTDNAVNLKLPDHNIPSLLIDRLPVSDPGRSTARQARVSALNSAYLVYTSGSTGRPKGVVVAHHNTTTFLHWVRATFSPARLDGLLATTSICFDISIFEIFGPLSWGGRIILSDGILDLPTLPARNQVTLINTVPSAMSQLLRLGTLPESVRIVILAGEALHRSLVGDLYRRRSIEKVYNGYGPSEDTTYSTFAMIDPTEKMTPVIGRPITNTRFYVLDSLLHPVAPGLRGELYLAGDGLARCYYGRQRLTALKFLPDAFSRQPGSRLYKTGDLVRLRLLNASVAAHTEPPNLEFLGRCDHQVKLRGFRIELGEIETVLEECAYIHEAVVQLGKDRNDSPALVAYVVANRQDNSDVRSFLETRLPAHMLPSFFVWLESLPRTPNGKLNRMALPEPDLNHSFLKKTSTAPQTPLERHLAGIWCKVLNLSQVGMEDDFFSLGGHSLTLTQVVSRIRETFGVDLPMSLAFQTATLSAHVILLLETLWQQVDGAVASGLLKRIEDLSTEEVRQLMSLDASREKSASAASSSATENPHPVLID
ncbi:MAG: amino acid adenylation domain-containing protein [Acidobacteriota bacterium]|nr:amino acid adenylation domain-containing protein [Acidobacteriota bacterium]